MSINAMYFLLIRRQRRPCLLAIDDGLSLAGQHAGREYDARFTDFSHHHHHHHHHVRLLRVVIRNRTYKTLKSLE